MNKSNIKKEKRERRHRKIRSTISGTSKRPRLSVSKTNTTMYLQLIDDEAGKTLVASSTKGMKGKTGMEKAAEAGKNLAKKATEKNIKAVVFDRGGFVYTGKIKAVAEGAREGGLKF
jgi:large subunit ribosomal protein L18